MRNFEVRESVSLDFLALNRSSTDDKRIFGQVKQIYNSPSYKMGTKNGVLDRIFPTSELMLLPSTIDLEIPVPDSDREITQYTVAARECTTDKLLVFCKIKEKRS